MLLYTEKQLEEAYHIDCKARTKNNISWVKLDTFRPIYEALVELHMIKALNENEDDVPEFVINAIKNTLNNPINTHSLELELQGENNEI